MKVPVKKGDLVFIGSQYPLLEVKDVYSLKNRLYVKCYGWLSQRYFGDLEANRVKVIED